MILLATPRYSLLRNFDWVWWKVNSLFFCSTGYQQSSYCRTSLHSRFGISQQYFRSLLKLLKFEVLINLEILVFLATENCSPQLLCTALNHSSESSANWLPCVTFLLLFLVCIFKIAEQIMGWVWLKIDCKVYPKNGFELVAANLEWGQLALKEIFFLRIL